jgi:hypothetical protein
MTDSHPKQLILALVLTNSGGEGKSTWSEIFSAIARLAGLKTQVVDLDPGNRGYLNRNGDTSAASLSWSASGAEAADPFDADAWFDNYATDKDLVVLDTGANMLAAANPINEFIGRVLQCAKGKGARIIIFGVTSPNKAGSDELIEAMYQRFRRGCEVIVVQNNRDGSNAFKHSLSQLGTPVINVPHLFAGLQAVRLRRCIVLEEVLKQPEPNYARATALIAKNVLSVATQPAVAEILGTGAVGALEEMAKDAPRGLAFRLSDITAARDPAVHANEELYTAQKAFRTVDAGDATSFIAAARRLHTADRKWLAVR